MAALWGGGAGHAGAGGTLPLRGTAESAVGNGLSSSQYLRAEDLHLSSLEAETVLEAGEFLETMHDYLDSSVISIIEDFSSFAETKSRVDAENELSLLTAITEILDSTDDESLSPFDTLPDSELLSSPRDRDNSSFQRFLSLSVTPPQQNFDTIEDFQEPRLCSIVAEKVETSSASLPLALTPGGPKDSAASKKPNGKGSWAEWRLFRHREREIPVRQRSDGEEEEEEEAGMTDCSKSFVGSMKEISMGSTMKEVGTELSASDGPHIITPESISLSELVRSMHPYCQPTLTVCLSPDSQPLAEELLAGPVVLEVVPEEGESMEIPVVLQSMGTQLPCSIESSCTADHADKEAILIAPAPEEVSSDDNVKTADLCRELDLDKQVEGINSTSALRIEDAYSEAREEAQKFSSDQENSSQSHQAGLNTSEKVHVYGCNEDRAKASAEMVWPQEARNSELTSSSVKEQARTVPSNSMVDVESPEKQPENNGGQGHGELLLGHLPQTKERSDLTEDELLKCELACKSPLVPSVESTRGSPCMEKQTLIQPLKGTDLVLSNEEDVQRENIVLENEGIPSSTVDIAEQPPRSENSSCTPKEAKPKPLSLSEYRRRRQHQQGHPSGGATRDFKGNQSANKWPSLPELPTKLPDLPCLVPPPPSSATVPKEAKEPEKPPGPSTAAGKTSTIPPSTSTQAVPLIPRSVPPLQQSSVRAPPPIAYPTIPIPTVSPLPSKLGAFPPGGVQVSPSLPPPYLPPASGAFLPNPPDSYMLSSQPPVPSWSHIAPLPPGYQSLPLPPPAAEACPPGFHSIPPVPPPTWLPPPPPVPLPSFAPPLSYSSVEWAAGPPPYWSGISVPPPMMPAPYGNQGTPVISPALGTLNALSFSEGTPGQESTASVPEEPSHFGRQCLPAREKPQLMPAQVPQVQNPSAAKPASRRVSDPRRKAQTSAVESKAGADSCSFPPSKKPLLSPLVAESLGEMAEVQHDKKSFTLQSGGKSHTLSVSQNVRDLNDVLKSSEPLLQDTEEKLAHAGRMEKTLTTLTLASDAKEVSHSRAEKRTSCSGDLLHTTVETNASKVASTLSSTRASSVPPKEHESVQLSKKPIHTWKYQPFINNAQSSRNKDIVQAFISEIGIEASDLSSLLEQFEKTEAQKKPSNVEKPKEKLAVGNDSPEMLHEKKMMDRLQAPELTNIAGLTPPATPPHQLWKPLTPLPVQGKAGSPKGDRMLKSISRLHRKALVPIHVGSGEHDYCQLTAAQSKEGSRWNIKHSLDVTIKPSKTMTKQVSDQPASNETSATIRLDPAGILGMPSAYQNPKEVPNNVGASQEQIKMSSSVEACFSPSISESLRLNSSCTSTHKEPLDHRTSTPKSMSKSDDNSCSVLLSPAVSPCRDAEEPPLEQPREVQQKQPASKRSLRCYRGRQKSPSPRKDRWRSQRNRTSQSFSSSSDGDSDSSSCSSSSSSRSSSSSSSRSRSPPSKRWRRHHSRSSRSSSCDRSWSWSRSRSRSSCSSYLSRSSSRSPSLCRRSTHRRRYDSSNSRERHRRQTNRYKERAIEERRVVFVGKIPSRMTHSELRHRFSVFGDIEDCTLHFREQGDNYGFVTYRYAEEAFAAIEGGRSLHRPDEQPFDLCFGGRRQFCRRNYADLDSNQDDFEPTHMKNKLDSLDFDTLLKQAQRNLRR